MPSESRPKFCVDCRHFLTYGVAPPGVCNHPQNYSKPNLVTGIRPRIWSAAALRTGGGHQSFCGASGGWFELKQTENLPFKGRS